MGYSRALRYACAVAAIAGLTACDKPARQSDIDDVRYEAAQLAIRVERLEAQNDELEAQLDTVRTVTLSNADRTDGLSKTLNANAQVANENAVKEMTRRGACGTRLVPLYANDGSDRQVGVRNEVIPCTLADLKP